MDLSHNLIIKDELLGQGVLNEFVLNFDSQTISIKELIEQRVRREVENYNLKAEQRHFIGLIQPNQSEIDLNGYRLKKGKRINAETQIEIALNAFETNGFFILIDDSQAETLDELIEISSGTKVSFVKLMPLVGG